MPPEMPGTAADDSTRLDDHVASALSYVLWPLSGVLFLVLEPYSSNRTVRFHAFQSVFSFGAFFIGFAFLQILSGIPFLGLIFLFLTSIYMLIWFGIVAIMAYKAYMKERFVLPIIGALAEKQV
jgi:uncharacterized membrane protein